MSGTIQDIDDNTLGVTGVLNSGNDTISGASGISLLEGTGLEGAPSFPVSQPLGTPSDVISTLGFPSNPVSYDSSSGGSPSITERINVHGSTPVVVQGSKDIVDSLKEYANTVDAEAVALVIAGLAAAGLIISATSGSGAVAAPATTTPSVEVKGQADKPPASGTTTTTTPPASGTTPLPVVVPPGGTTTPSTDPADPNKEAPKQEPTAEEKSLAEALGIPAATLSTLLKYGLPALASYLSYQSAKDAQEQARGASFSASGPTTATRTTYGGSRYSAAQGGVASLAGGGEISQPFYLGGSTDGMADEIPAHIDNKRPAALSDGEFVVPADVVSHLGNGNSNAGAKRLYEMMDRIREARTGNSKQGIQINPNKFMPR